MLNITETNIFYFYLFYIILSVKFLNKFVYVFKKNHLIYKLTSMLIINLI